MATVQRRMRPANAAARGQSVRSEEEEIGKGYVSTSIKDRSGPYHEEHKEVEVSRTRFSVENPAAFIRVGAGLTINMDNFESLRIDCAVTLPCLPTGAGMQKAYETASNFVADKIAEEQTNWLGAVKPKQGKGR